jgi:hypothetical protein
MPPGRNALCPIRLIQYPVWCPLGCYTLGLQHSDCLQRTSFNTYATVLTEPWSDVGQIVWGLLLPKIKGTLSNGRARSLTAFLGVAFMIVHRNL